MTGITTITSLPPEIIQSLSADLLSLKVPKLGDDLETLWEMYLKAKKWSERKVRSIDKGKKAICDKAEKEFLELYERAKAKEKDMEAKKKNSSKRFFYFIHVSNRTYAEIFGRFKYRKV